MERVLKGKVNEAIWGGKLILKSFEVSYGSLKL